MRKPAAKKAPARRKSTARPAKAPARARKPTARARAKRPAAEHDYPMGMAVADAFALERLKAPKELKVAPKKAVREIGWAAFGEIARQLATRIGSRFRPDAVLGIAKGGVFVGSAVASTLGADFFPVRVESRRRDAGAGAGEAEPFPVLKGKKVLVVDDVCQTGATLAKAGRMARKAGAKDIRSATLVVRPGGARPDWSALETDSLVLFGWDYQLDQTDAGQVEMEPIDDVDPGEVGV